MADWAFEVRATSRAPVEVVWPLVGEAARWKEWSFLTRSGLEREGEPAPDGVGAIRRFTSLGMGSREEVVVWEPPRHLGYVILSGFPVRNYRGDVVLTAEGGRTTLTWSASFDTKIPGTGRLTHELLYFIIGRFAAGVVRTADASLQPSSR
ncbi:MAG TPA: SRPBCC family protein [Acidimicrobiales bacterium]|nr:SRPBCC family protein [Acidimicrobiales bacterium]